MLGRAHAAVMLVFLCKSWDPVDPVEVHLVLLVLPEQFDTPVRVCAPGKEAFVPAGAFSVCAHLRHSVRVRSIKQ